MERLRQLLHSVQLPWSTTPRLDAAWRRRVAFEMLESLSPQRLAKSITSQVVKIVLCVNTALSSRNKMSAF